MPTSRKVLGYALVNCANAHRALETLSPRGQIIWIQDDRENVATVSLENVDIRNTELIYAACSTYGNIIACNIGTQKDLVSGFIRLEPKDSAREVIPKVNEIISKYERTNASAALLSHSPPPPSSSSFLMGTTGGLIGGARPAVGVVDVEMHSSSREYYPVFGFDDFTNVYVKNLDDNVDSAKLIELFSVFGPINSAIVMTEDGISKGFGFVDFEYPQSARQAIKDMNGKKIGSRTLYVTKAQSRVDRPDRPKIFVPHYPY